VTGNVSKAIASLSQAWSRKNVTIGQTDVDKQVTDSFAKLVAIGVVYRTMLMVILLGSLLVHVVIVFALPLAVVGAFVAVAVTGHARDLSALIGLLMLIDIVDINATVLLTLAVATNAIVLLALVQHKIEAGADGQPGHGGDRRRATQPDATQPDR
jgi:multidrug efflux pump subunit AcrB